VFIEQDTRFNKVEVDLLDEERVSLGFAVDHSYQGLRGRLAGEGQQHGPYSVEGQPPQVQPFHQAAPVHVEDDVSQRMREIHVEVSVRAQDKYGHLGQQRRQVLGEQHGRLVGPVHVLKHQQ
jgi:hypothetical protein